MIPNKINSEKNKTPTILKSISVLAGSIFIGQLMSILFTPLLTRIYSPEDFGVFSAYTAILTILTVGSTLRFELAIPLPKEEQRAHSLVLLSILAVFTTSLFFSLLFYFCNLDKLYFLNSPVLIKYFYLIPIGILLSGVFITLNYWAIRRERYDFLGRTKLYQASSSVFVKLLLGLLGIKPLGLIIGFLSMQVTGIGLLFSLFGKDKKSYIRTSLKEIKKTASIYKKFPLISSWSAIINEIGVSLPILLLTTQYGLRITGFFSLSMLAVGIPLTTIGQAISQVFLGRASKLKNQDMRKIRNLYLKIIKTLFLIGIAPFTVLFLWSSKIFPFVFGNEWIEAGNIAQILSLMFFTKFVMVPLSQILVIFEKQEIQLSWDILRLIIVFTTIYIPSSLGYSYLTTLIYFGVGMTAAYFILFLVQLIIINKFKYKIKEDRL